MIARFVRAAAVVLSTTLALTVSVAVTACGGGGGGGGGGAPVGDPPTGLSYLAPVVVYEAQVAIPANTPSVGGGPVTLFSIVPALPSGLTLDATTGVISGTPAVAASQSVYTVTAQNDDGSTSTPVTLTVTLNRADNLAAKASFTDDDIRYFLGRTQFGPKSTDLAAVKAVGLPAYVDTMVEYGFDAAFEANAANLLVNVSDPVGLEGGFPGREQIARYWMQMMFTTPTPFQEVMAMFWHDHFAASTTPIESSATAWMRTQITLWRQQGNGNLRTMLLAMTRDYVMLRWLDGVSNNKFAPNENFAREFWELFTLGVDNGYTQADILQSAKAFTGYMNRFNAVTNQEFVTFETSLHDAGPKTFFGQTIAAQNVTDDYQRVVDITVDNRPVAEFISKKLYQYFCNANPTTIPTDAMAALLRTNGYELKPLLKALFKSEAFFCPASKSGIVKNPVEHVIGFIRSTGLVPIDPKSAANDPAVWPNNTLRTLDTNLSTAAMRPSQPPTVNGWPIGDQWLSSQNMLDRGNAILDCIRDRTDQTAAGISVAALLPTPTATADQVVDAFIDLLHVAPTAAERTTYIAYLNSSAGAGGVPTTSPFNPADATHLSERVRGLLYILAQHPTYAVR